MKITKKYLAPKNSQEDMRGEVELEIKEISAEEAPIAFVVTEEKRENEIRWYNNKLWGKIFIRGAQFKEIPLSLIDHHISVPCVIPTRTLDPNFPTVGIYPSQKNIEDWIKNFSNRFMIIDNFAYEVCEEPFYAVVSFGKGDNHGRTFLEVCSTTHSSPLVKRTFNALERDKAIEATREIALQRGDTGEIDLIGKDANIKVLIPGAVRCTGSSAATM